jgi:hypothetical protein
MLYNPQTSRPQQPRHHCRNPRCGTALKVPADNPRDAFCCRGCEGQYYGRHCRVCGALFAHKTKRRIVCSRAKCRYQFKRHPEQFFGDRYPSGPMAHNASKNPIKPGIKIGAKPGRAFRIVAGPGGLYPINLQLPPDLPVSKANATFREHCRAAGLKALFQRDVPPANIVGTGAFKFPGAPNVDLNPARATPRAPAAGPPIGDGLDIPDFLRRTTTAPAGCRQ